MGYDGAKDGKHYWLTPPDLMADLEAEFGFTFDPCPFPQPEGFNGLDMEWGVSNYVNPPFKGATVWARKSIAEHAKGKTVVLVFPVERWIARLIGAGAELRSLGDLKWHPIEGGKPKAAGPIAAFILRG